MRARRGGGAEDGMVGVIDSILSVSDSDRRVPAELGQESQASSCLRKGPPLVESHSNAIPL